MLSGGKNLLRRVPGGAQRPGRTCVGNICRRLKGLERLTPSANSVSSGLTHSGQEQGRNQEHRSQHTPKEHITAMSLQGENKQTNKQRLLTCYANPALQSACFGVLGPTEKKSLRQDVKVQGAAVLTPVSCTHSSSGIFM